MGVVDIGSNTSRLLVAEVRGNTIETIEKGRVRLALGEEIERTGSISETSMAKAAKAARKLSGLARSRGAEVVDVFLTAPGRQSANADDLVATVARATSHSVRVLTTEEEGRLAYAGAVATAEVELYGTVAVCDVGGASTEVAVGNPDRPPGWIASVDLGSVRLTARTASLDEARREARIAFADVEPERVDTALCVGGTARATRRLVGPRLGRAELREALRFVDTLAPRELTRRFGVDRARARILPAGVAILAEVGEILGVPLHVCSGGIREGALLSQLAERAA
jgi:exopolyphosphatase/guanosine-5'-triphosphate,3'-diphosphate pyrophosphatase